MLVGISDNFPTVFSQESGKPTSGTYRAFAQKWGWKKTLFSIAQDDITKVEKVQKTHLSTIMEFLSYLYDKNDADEAEMKFQQARNNK